MLLDKFYEKVKIDPVISFFFTEIAKVDWDHHMPILYDFWEATLLGTRQYKRNVMEAHLQLNKKEPLQKQHFERWLQLFSETIDGHFEGEAANEAKTRAKNIAALMEFKISSSF